MSEVVTIRLSKSRKETVSYLSKYKMVPQSQAINQLLDKGMVEVATELYKDKKVSLGRAAKIAGLTISEMLDVLAEKNISSNVSIEDFKESLKHLNKI